MVEQQFPTPIAFIIFNRPDTTKRVFAEIAKVRPKSLYVISDGPRTDKLGEKELVDESRAIIDQIDWDCEVFTNYSEINLGCKKRVSSGVDWVFEHVDKAIILEDDCLPEPSFFVFCQEMLERYRDDTSVAMITGDNFQNGIKRGEADYYFTKYAHIWGWATWRRAWEKYDVSLTKWPELKEDRIFWKDLSLNSSERVYWQRIFQQVYDGKIDTWDYQWTFACWVNRMASVIPNRNLISNIGFGVNATHTIGASEYANMTTSPMKFPLKHPALVQVDTQADQYTARGMFKTSIVVSLIKKTMPKKLIKWLQLQRNTFFN